MNYGIFLQLCLLLALPVQAQEGSNPPNASDPSTRILEEGAVGEDRSSYINGVICYGKRDFENALHHLDQSIQEYPEANDAFLLRGMCHLHRHEPLKARFDFDHYVDGEKEKTESLDVIGKLFYSFGQYEYAEDYFREAVRLDVSFAAAYSNLGSILIEKNALDEAGNCLTRAVELDPELAEALVNLGILHFMLEEFSPAEKAFLAAAELNEEKGIWDPIVYANLGDLYFVLRKPEPCIGAYTLALKLNPELTDIRTRLGIVLCLGGDQDLGKEQLETAVAAGDEPPAAHTQLAAIHLLEGRLDEAIAEYKRAIHLSRERDGVPIEALAKIYMTLGCFRQALALYRKAYDLGARSPELLAGLSRLSELCGFESDAITFYRLLEEADGSESIRLYETAKRCAESGIEGIQDPERAITITSRFARNTGFGHPGILDFLASAFAKSGDYEQAVETQKLAIRALPDGSPVLSLLNSRLEEYTVRCK